MTLNSGAETLMRGGIARQITNAEGLKILAECQAAGLAQTADNVQKGVGYICNCCGCCCGMMRASKTFGLSHSIVSSNWIAAVHDEKCSGCGLCVKACPPGALALEPLALEERGEPRPGGTKPKKRAALTADLCLGCGVCATVCKKGGVAMEARPVRVFTPETTFDRMLAMAIERGKLANLLAEDPESLTWQAIARVVRAIEAAPPVKAALAVRPLRSAFLAALLPLARLGSGNSASVE
jgi:ferredoxin